MLARTGGSPDEAILVERQQPTRKRGHILAYAPPGWKERAMKNGIWLEDLPAETVK